VVTVTDLPADLSGEQWAGLLRSARRSAVHLELRDVYAVGNEQAAFERWRATGEYRRPDDHPWFALIWEVTGRGVQVRRARVVSEPVSEYIRFEHTGTWQNVAAGEQVRWLPRRLASLIALPGNDFWLLDDERVMFNLFDGAGRRAAKTLTDDPAAVELCRTAFERVWEHAVPHERYTPR
jgi:hypothetical protein